MNALPKQLSILAATALLALGVAACGGGGDSTSMTGTTSNQKEGATTTTSGGASKNAGSGGNKGKSSGSGEAKEASKFVPKQHTNSGGGSKQFVVPGGDNSIQEYGSEASSTEFDQAAATLHNFLDARAEGNWAAACSYMSQVLIKSLETLAAHTKELKGCAEILDKLTNPAGKGVLRAEAAQANVASLRVKGKQAFVIYTGPKGAVIAVGMTPEGGIWKVSNLTGTPLN